MKNFLIALFVCMAVMSASPALSFDGIGISGGYSNSEEVTFFRGAVKVDPGWTFYSKNNWDFGVHFDFAITLLSNDSDVVNTNDAPDSLAAISVTPVLRLQRTLETTTLSPFFEFAVGASLFTDSKLQNKEPTGIDFGGNFQFEDKITLGLQFGESRLYEVAVSYFHYSNAGLSDQNDGIDIFSATFAIRF